MVRLHDNPQERADYFRAWQSADTHLMLAEHAREQMQEGIYQRFLVDMPPLITELFATKNYGRGGDRIVKELTRVVMNSEYPLVIMADSNDEKPDDTLKNADPLGLIKANPKTGRSVRYKAGRCPFSSFGEMVEGVYRPDKDSIFTEDQAQVLLKQAKEQIEVGLHPQLVYRYTWF